MRQDRALGPQPRGGALPAAAPQHPLRPPLASLLPPSRGVPEAGTPQPLFPADPRAWTSKAPHVGALPTRPCCHLSVPETLSLALPSPPAPPQHIVPYVPHLTAASCVASRAEAAGALGPVLAGSLVSAGAGQEMGTGGGRCGTGRAAPGRWDRGKASLREECGMRGSRARRRWRRRALPLLTCLRSWGGPFPHSVGPGSQWHRGRRGRRACPHRCPR